MKFIEPLRVKILPESQAVEIRVNFVTLLVFLPRKVDREKGLPTAERAVYGDDLVTERLRIYRIGL